MLTLRVASLGIKRLEDTQIECLKPSGALLGCSSQEQDSATIFRLIRWISWNPGVWLTKSKRQRTTHAYGGFLTREQVWDRVQDGNGRSGKRGVVPVLFPCHSYRFMRDRFSRKGWIKKRRDVFAPRNDILDSLQAWNSSSSVNVKAQARDLAVETYDRRCRSVRAASLFIPTTRFAVVGFASPYWWAWRSSRAVGVRPTQAAGYYLPKLIHQLHRLHINWNRSVSTPHALWYAYDPNVEPKGRWADRNLDSWASKRCGPNLG